MGRFDMTIMKPDGGSRYDRDLLIAIRSGEPKAHDELVRRHWDAVIRYVYGLTQSVDAAEDFAQETFIRVWERREQWAMDGSVRALVIQIARNLALDGRRIRKLRFERLKERRLSAPPSPTPEELAVAGELAEAIESAIRALPARRREVLLLARWSDLSYDDIASVMGITRRTVANLMSLALADMRAALADHTGEVSATS